MSTELGPCCICETTEKVRNIIQLNRKCVVPGHGWGCLVCDLPADGASAVLCDTCLDIFENNPKGAIKFACKGYPAKDGRIPIDQLEGTHEHDMELHRFEEQNQSAEHPIGIPWG